MLEVTVCIADRTALRAKMKAIRKWFDRRRFEPVTFRYQYTHYGVIVRVSFLVETEATDFAHAFEGELTNESPQTP
jgi:hypothetical protein